MRSGEKRRYDGMGGEEKTELQSSTAPRCAAARSKSRQTRSYFFSGTPLLWCIPQQLRSNKQAARGHQHTADASQRHLHVGQFPPQLSQETRRVFGADGEPAVTPTVAVAPLFSPRSFLTCQLFPFLGRLAGLEKQK